MLDWVLSKVICSIFTVGIIIFAVGYFAGLQKNYEYSDLESITSSIAEKVNEVCRTQANTSIVFVGSAEKDGIYLERKVNGEFYKIDFYRYLLVLRLGTQSASSRLNEGVHLWKPSVLDFNTTKYAVETLDSNNSYLTIETEDFVCEQQLFLVDGKYQYLSFVYKV